MNARSRHHSRRAVVAALAGALLGAPIVGHAWFEIRAPWGFAFDGATMRFDQVSIVETIAPCARTNAQLMIQIRATPWPFAERTPGEVPVLPQIFVDKGRRGFLLAEKHLGKVGPARFGCPVDVFDLALPVTLPPPGTYYVTAFVFASPSTGDVWCTDWRYCLEDWKPLAGTLTVGDATTGARPATR